MGALLSCGGAIANIRNMLQQYKDDNAPDDASVTVSMKDIIIMLNLTHSAWFALESIENRMQDMFDRIGRL